MDYENSAKASDLALTHRAEYLEYSALVAKAL
jgi:hypothetical protein